MRSLYMSKANRDAAFKAAGGVKAGLKKTSIRNQQLHPQYVADYEQVTGIVLTAADKGFGNGIYDTGFGVLYSWNKVQPVDKPFKTPVVAGVRIVQGE